MYKNIVKKYYAYMKEHSMLSGEEELILKTSLTEGEPELEYANVYNRYCKSKSVLIPSSFWNEEELKCL